MYRCFRSWTFLSPNNPKREVNRTAKLGRINT